MATQLQSSATQGTTDDEDDPITASYNVYLNPALPLGRRLLVLQQPNRTDDAPRPPPAELRLKSGAGMVEVDLPLDSTTAYDREKGLRWGKALHASMEAKRGGSHGLAGGFGVGAVQQRAGVGGRKRTGDAADIDDGILDWNEAVKQDKVLRTQTLGGQYPESKEVQYMVGVFQGKDLHLTPVTSLVHVRPQLHHIDAINQLERHSNSKDASSASAAAGTSSAPRAIHMTIKTTTDGDVVATETIADRLRSVQSEPWRTLRHTDENEEAAWEIYNESLFLRPREDATTGEGGDETQLAGSVPEFSTKWGDQDLLEAVSGITKPKTPSSLQNKDDTGGKQAQQAQVATTQQRPPESKKERTTRPRGGGATGAAKRGGKLKASSSKAGQAAT